MVSLNDISISTNKDKLDVLLIHAFLTNSYWAKGRSIETIQKSIDHSFCFGLFYKEKQIGFARVASDAVIFAYIMDVFLLEEYRGQGLSKLLLNYMLDESELKEVENWILATNDAHGVYRKLGFIDLAHPERFMQRYS